MTDISKILEERGKTHGDYADHADCTQWTKRFWRTFHRWDSLTDEQAESLDMIAHKVGRVLAGDPNHKDHWVDIAGYAQLVVDSLNDKPE